MRGFWAVFRREVAERWLLLVGAGVASLFPLLVPWLPGVAGYAEEARAGTAVALSLTVAGVLAVALGASVIAGDLAERRLGFYFARPVAGWALWAGKLAGAAVLAVGSALLVLVPTLLIDRRIELGVPGWVNGVWIRHLPAFLLSALAVFSVVAGCVLILLLSHLVSTMARSRSPWLLLDLGATFALAALFWSLRGALLREGALDAFLWALGGCVAALFAAALAASAVQVTRGRTDPRRAHRLLSSTFWGGLGAAGLAFAAYVHWVLAVSPTDLRKIEVLSAPAGPWVGLSGPAAGRGGYCPAFLFDAATGRSVRIAASPAYRWDPQPAFAPDGGRAAWLQVGRNGYELQLLDLTRPGARPKGTAVSFEEWPRWIALGPRGKLFAALHGSSLTVDDLTTGRLLAAIPIAANDESVRLRFSEDGHLRIYEAGLRLVENTEGTEDAAERWHRHNAWSWRLTTRDLAPGSNRLTQVGRFELSGDAVASWALSPDGERVAVRLGGNPLRLLDVRTGALIASVAAGGGLAYPFFLSDGRLILSEMAHNEATSGRGVTSVLGLLDRDGRELRRFAFADPHVALGGEVAPGLLVVATRGHGSYADPAGWSSFLLNVDSGRTTLIGRDLIPASRGGGGPRSLGSRLFLRADGELALLDPTTGTLRTLLRTAR